MRKFILLTMILLSVMAVFSDHIYSARSVTKTNTYDVMAISAGEMGAMGIVRDRDVYFYEQPLHAHTVQTEFDVSNLTELPDVSILYFAADADPGLLEYAAKECHSVKHKTIKEFCITG